MTGAVSPRLIGGAIHVRDEVDSTQAVLATLAAEGAPEGTVVTAEHQTAGRGRRGRSWWDGPRESLLLSVLLRPPIPTARAPQISLVAAVAVVDALAARGVAASVRWPNDILVGDRKVCGILAEAAAEAGGRLQHVLVGIGINVNQARFPGELREAATSLRLATGRALDRGRLRDALLDALEGRYAEFLAEGFAPLRAAWLARSATLGRPARLPDGRRGTAVDVDEDGALLVRAEGGGELVRLGSGGIADAPGY